MDIRAQELCESRGGRPGLPVLNSPYGLCGHKATLNCNMTELRSCVKVEVGRPGFPVLNSPYGLCGHKATLNCNMTELRSCVKVEVAVPGSPSLISICFCGRNQH